MMSSTGQSFGRAVISEISNRRALLALVGLYWAACEVAGLVYERPIKPLMYAPVFAGIALAIALFFVVRSAVRVSGKRKTGARNVTLYEDLKSELAVEDVARLVVLLTGFSLVISVFQSAKAMIPAIQPFVYDVPFAEIDKAVHGGFYPHEILQPLMGFPLVSFVVLILYNLWLPLVFVVFMAQILDRSNPQLQRRYLMSFFLAWVLIGTFAAVLLSSAGPVYYEQVVGLAPGTGPYAGLMAYYGDVEAALPFFLGDMHAMLWQFYQDGSVGPGAGISAMPSVHVALATHMFVVMRHRGQIWARIFGVYAVIIMLGSVHLGWHYAVDGYLGAALVGLIWWFSGAMEGVRRRRDTRCDTGAPLDADQGLAD
jgi:hypothetical protein